MSTRVNYDEVANGYDRRYADHEYAGIARALDAFAQAGHDVLEVGCGTGHWLVQLAGRSCRVVGLDPSREMLARAADKVEADRLVLGRAERLPMPDGSFDRVVVVNALHHFDAPEVFAREAFRVLRPGGEVLVVGLDPTSESTDWFVYDYFDRTRQLDEARYPNADRIARWLEGAGLTASGSSVAHTIDIRWSARTVLDEGRLTRHSTSQLSLIGEAEFSAGVQRVVDALQRDPALELRCHLELRAIHGTRASSISDSTPTL